MKKLTLAVRLMLTALLAVGAVTAHADDPPQIAITSPAHNDTVGGTVVLSGTASDDLGLQRLEVRLGTGPWIEIQASGSWSYRWVTLDLAGVGSITGRARVTDTGDQVSEDSIAVTVANPSVSLPQDAVIVAIGDSITAGDNAPTAWPDELQTLLDANGRNDVTVINEGEGGLSSKEFWLDASHQGFKKSNVAGHPSIDVAFVMLGHNDTRQDDTEWHAITPADHAQYLENTVAWLQARTNLNGRTTRVVVMTPVPATEPVIDNHWQFPADFNLQMQTTDGYIERALDVAASQGADALYTVPLFDGGAGASPLTRAANASLITGDTIHPNGSGQVALAGLALSKLDLSIGGPATAGAVPDGGDRPGPQLLVARLGAGPDLALSWGTSCLAADTDYGIYEGSLGSFGGQTPLACSTGGATSAAITPATGNRYYLVVPAHESIEGSYGRDSAGAERPPGPGPCAVQAIAPAVCTP